MKIFEPLRNFHGFPDFGLEVSVCQTVIETLKIYLFNVLVLNDDDFIFIKISS